MSACEGEECVSTAAYNELEDQLDEVKSELTVMEEERDRLKQRVETLEAVIRSAVSDADSLSQTLGGVL